MSDRDARVLDPLFGVCPGCSIPVRLARAWTAVCCGACGLVVMVSK